MIRTFLLGVLLTYSTLLTFYATAIHTGHVASITQACVQHESQQQLSNADYLTQLDRHRK